MMVSGRFLNQFHIRTGHGPERGNRRDAHHHKDHAEDQGEQGGPQGQFDIDQKRTEHVILAEEFQESAHQASSPSSGVGGL